MVPSTPSRRTGIWAPAKPCKAQLPEGGFGRKLETQLLVGMEVRFFSVLVMLLVVGKKVGAICLLWSHERNALAYSCEPFKKNMQFGSIWWC